MQWRAGKQETEGQESAGLETAGQESRKQKTCLGNLLPKIRVIYFCVGDVILLEVVLLLKYFEIIEHGKQD